MEGYMEKRQLQNVRKSFMSYDVWWDLTGEWKEEH